MEEQKKYTLYIGKIQNVPQNVKYAFYNETYQYILIYTAEMPTEGDFKPIPEDLHGKLTDKEKSWLFAVKTTINAEYIKSNMKNLNSSVEDFIRAFEEQLQIKKEELERLKNEQNADSEQRTE